MFCLAASITPSNHEQQSRPLWKGLVEYHRVYMTYDIDIANFHTLSFSSKAMINHPTRPGSLLTSITNFETTEDNLVLNAQVKASVIAEYQVH